MKTLKGSLLVFVLVALVSGPVAAAMLEINTGESSFFGQRGGAVIIDGSSGETDFGHVSGNTGSDSVSLSGDGSFETFTLDGSAEGFLSHAIDIDTEPNRAVITMNANVNAGLFAVSAIETVEFTDGIVGGGIGTYRTYADVRGKSVFTIIPETGENFGDSVNVNIFAIAGSHISDTLFTTEARLGGKYPNDLNIWHNKTEIFDAGGPILSPDDNNPILGWDGLNFMAVIGDTITIDAAIWAYLWGEERDIQADFFDTYESNINFHAEINLSPAPVPIPATFLLFASSLAGILGLRKKTRGLL